MIGILNISCEFLLDEFHMTSLLKINIGLGAEWFGAIKQQVTTWTNIDHPLESMQYWTV